MFRLAAICVLFLLSCNQQNTTPTGPIERLHPGLDAILDTNAHIEVIAQGFEWAEGPLWIEESQMLLFSDVPKNTVYKWTETKGKEIYLMPSGYTGATPRGGELGSNGLARMATGQLVLCQHGDRRVARLEAPVQNGKPQFSTLAGSYGGRRFNSPNDLVFDAKGNLYFTDPPYGLLKNMEDSSKELAFQGVYKRSPDGTVTLLVDSITRPNGIALTPDGRRLIVANSDSLKSAWYIYDVNPDGSLSNGKIFYDATATRKREQGNPDGLKIDKRGNVFATGPGGVWIFNGGGTLLGKIRFGEKVSNCAFSADEKTLYITADDYLLRVRLRR
jgi:gluconolactonase